MIKINNNFESNTGFPDIYIKNLVTIDCSKIERFISYLTAGKIQTLRARNYYNSRDAIKYFKKEDYVKLKQLYIKLYERSYLRKCGHVNKISEIDKECFILAEDALYNINWNEYK